MIFPKFTYPLYMNKINTKQHDVQMWITRFLKLYDPYIAYEVRISLSYGCNDFVPSFYHPCVCLMQT